jgi:hypothetical protein
VIPGEDDEDEARIEAENNTRVAGRQERTGAGFYHTLAGFIRDRNNSK